MIGNVTKYGHIVVMSQVRIAQLKARLSEYLREVRRGRTVTVLQRETPIARLVPYRTGEEPLEVRKPKGRYPSLQRVPLPTLRRVDEDVVALLLEERQVDR